MRALHPSRQELEVFFFSGKGGSAIEPDVVQHLFGECAQCAQEVGRLLTEPGVAPDQALMATPVGAAADSRAGDLNGRCDSKAQRSRFNRAFREALTEALKAEKRLARERAEASALISRLLSQPCRRQLMIVHNSRRYHTRSVCEGLLDASWRARFDDPQHCADLARVALAVSQLLPGDSYGRESLQDLRARCWAELANALRILSDYSGAEDAFGRAAELLRQGSGSPSEEARFLDLRASLFSARTEYRKAESSVTRAIALYREVGDVHSLGVALLTKGMIANYAGDPEREIVLVRLGLELASVQIEPRLVVIGWHNLIWSLHDLGHGREALAALGRARPLYLELADRTSLLRFQWLEGTIARSLGRVEQAEGCLAEAREGFIRLGTAHDAALVSLELAAVLADQGRDAEVCSIAAEMIAIFESLESRKETLAALILLRKAAERGRVTERLVQRLVASVQRARSPA